MTEPNTVILHIVRGGKDPDEYWHLISSNTADLLDQDDPLKGLEDRDIIEGYLGSLAGAIKAAEMRGLVCEDDVWDAAGY